MSEAIAQAYVQIVPSADGISGKIANIFSGEGEAAGSTFGSKFGGAVKGAAGTILKSAAVGVTAAAGAIAAVGKSALDAYGDFEQLSGGVETLFGDAADAVMQNASNAFKTAGLSANEYMETVTSFSAGLIASMGGDTAEAAKVADMAITDMADNANKMGSSIESIQNAYQGFAKQNYTMLDNLKLGYGGTKSEMERLLADAEKFSGIHYDISNLNDVYEAIHVVQTEMGITGTTAEEAASTIQGSVSMMKSSWENFVAGLANPDADLSQLSSQLVDSVMIVTEHITPIISQMLPQIATGLSELVGQIAPKLPEMIQELLPSLITGATDLFTSLAAELPELLRSLVSAIPMILEELFGESGAEMGESFMSLFDGLMSAVEQLGALMGPVFEAVLPVLAQLFESFSQIANVLIEALMPIIEALMPVFTTLVQLIGPLVELLASILAPTISAIAAVLTPIIQVIASIANSILSALIPAVQSIAKWFGEVCPPILEKFKGFIDSVKQAVIDAWNKVKPVLEKISSTVTTVFNSIWSICKSIVNKVIGGIEKMVNGMIKGINKLLDGISKVASVVGEALGFGSVSLQLSEISLPKLERGGILKKGQVGLLEGNGAEAVVPLDNNSKWISAVAKEMNGQTTGNNGRLATMIAESVAEALQNMTLRADIELETDNRKLFNIIQSEAKIYTNTTGVGAF